MLAGRTMIPEVHRRSQIESRYFQSVRINTLIRPPNPGDSRELSKVRSCFELQRLSSNISPASIRIRQPLGHETRRVAPVGCFEPTGAAQPEEVIASRLTCEVASCTLHTGRPQSRPTRATLRLGYLSHVCLRHPGHTTGFRGLVQIRAMASSQLLNQN